MTTQHQKRMRIQTTLSLDTEMCTNYSFVLHKLIRKICHRELQNNRLLLWGRKGMKLVYVCGFDSQHLVEEERLQWIEIRTTDIELLRFYCFLIPWTVKCSRRNVLQVLCARMARFFGNQLQSSTLC